MRFDLLLSQYLYQHKKLNLPGIGTFETDSSTMAWDENGKQKQAGSGITFKNATITKADDGLIEFITEQTGKMKPLAISDLESYLTLGKQFLYIGKPFYLEGIGTLQFAKAGNFDFIPGEYVTTKLEDPSLEKVDERKRTTAEEERLSAGSNRQTGRLVLTWLIILLCLGLVAWGGYYFYTMNARQKVSTVRDTGADSMQNTRVEPLPAENNVASVPTGGDTTTVRHPVANTSSDNNIYKFIVESTTNKQRALTRYRKLKAYGNEIEMETADSVNFNLYFNLPATTADTLRLRDSLNKWYYGNATTHRVVVVH